MDRALGHRRGFFRSLGRELDRGQRDLAERVGGLIGHGVAPLFAVTSALRRARTFHPRGDCANAVVELNGYVPQEYRALADQLVGKAFVRLSDALTKRKARWPDVLGCAVRLGGDADYPSEDGDQDLLFATIKRPWTMPFAPFTTNVHDYLANDYFAVSPFSIPTRERVYFRLRPDVSPAIEPPRSGLVRRERATARRRRLERAIANGSAVLVLGVSRRARGPFVPLVQLRLVSIWQTDAGGLHMDPFRSGRRIEPRGFIHALRRGAYSASQHARP